MKQLTLSDLILTPTIAATLLERMPLPQVSGEQIIYLPQEDQFFCKDGRVYLFWDDYMENWLLLMNLVQLDQVEGLVTWTSTEIERMANLYAQQEEYVQMMLHIVKTDEPDMENFWRCIYESLLTGHNEHRVKDSYRMMYEALVYMQKVS
jgi:hypothetical protein